MLREHKKPLLVAGLLLLLFFIIIGLFLSTSNKDTTQQTTENNNLITQSSSTLQSEKPAITTLLSEQFIISSWEVSSEQIYSYHGTFYYGATLLPPVKERFGTSYDAHRILLRKDNNAWVIISHPPQLIFSYEDFPNVPRPVIDAINRLP